ncbi:MAG: UDP-N-acetylglucosamine 2-epimerase (non-hydrolyzing) [Anaerolineae bacterium]|nr:UDP-N-acetylglucosamine 2-epimerase (non-hydrolyzing) [Anaerolineae bacterium]
MTSSKRILTVVGARPQFIKAAPLSKVLRARHTELLVHTGQHYDNGMSNVFFDELAIPAPDVNLGIGSGTHAEQLSAMLEPLERLMLEQRPDLILVYGDTNSTLAGALAAAKLNLPIAHVEAGLRSYNRAMPEEINRVLTDHVSRWLLCPTQEAVNNLAKEGIKEGVTVTGDIMVDAVLQNVDRARITSTVRAQCGLQPNQPYLLATIHRPANTDVPAHLTQIMQAFAALEYPVVFPVHPRTRKSLAALDLYTATHVRLIDPVGYLDMLALLDGAALVVTDSGGLQKEAYLLKRPCVTVRTETEWVETVSSGWNLLSEPTVESIRHAVQHMLTHVPAVHPDFYGDGTAAQQIVAALES